MENMAMLNELISRNGITMAMKRVDSNPILSAEEGWDGIEHFRCRLSRPGKEVDVYLSVDSTGDTITVSDVLMILAMDASGCKMLEGYDRYTDALSFVFGGTDGNLAEIEDFWQEYAGRCQQTKALRRFLGDAEYDELVRHYGLS